ncbi:unnamed protein product [Notodromas monacha]|uniref:Cytochrome c oxidase subunit n=1 Tax=Notodromas monacha TaxID=399045 RepID=A0A7R9C1X3_9CRUS|nr:unnamed protein product [Notodromas monacha]CAG0925419.1 unnamed protein product [Notodromas monacha]
MNRGTQITMKRLFSTSQRMLAEAAGEHAGGMDLWRKLTFFGAFPVIALCAVKTYLDVTQHPHEPPEFIKYDHLRIRTKRFPWGDGNHSFFHNPHANALPDGYEHSEEHH